MRRLLASLVLVLVAGPVFAQEKTADGDMKKLQGKWSAKGPDGSPITIVFEGVKVSIKIVTPMGEERTIEGDCAIDDKATPKAMTWTHVKVRNKDVPDLAAIYAIPDDDTLKIAGVGGTTRPKEFVEKGKELPGMRPNTMTLSRLKDEADKK